MLRMEKADVFYGASQILFGVDLVVERGETMALLGRNGAGKSTTFKAIAGIAPPKRGRITLGGETISGRAPYRIAPRRHRIRPRGPAGFPRTTRCTTIC